ncbi:MAG TPA: hypothetical protein VD863_02385 [Bradyrhizobium sp.]|nr:hypothetical protein [Bradyrhizobium sp.]
MPRPQEGAPPSDQSSPVNGASHTSDAFFLVCAVLGVCAVYIVVLDWRFPYIHQLPVFDLDYITSILTMFARNWWIEKPWSMAFSMPYAPLSVETPTLALRHGMYQTWPPGAVFSIYALAQLTGIPPNITMVNWLNVAGHGLIALFLSLSGYFIAEVLRRSKIERVAIAIVVACVVLFPRGPVYFFSQIFSFDTHIVVFYAALVFLATLECRAAGQPTTRRLYGLQIAVLVWGLFVDWLFYFVYAVWLALRYAGAKSGYGRPMTRRETGTLTILPLVTFSMFLVWRFVTPGPIALRQGFFASVQDLVWKVFFRIGVADDYPVSATTFFGPFYRAHEYFYWKAVPILLGAGFVTCVALFYALFANSRENPERRAAYFGLFAIFLLSIFPAYLQMIVFKQHTYIHPWSIAKVVVPLAMVPGVFLPLLAATAFDRWFERRPAWAAGSRQATVAGVLAFAIGMAVVSWPRNLPYLLGRIDPSAAAPWKAIQDNTSYHDVVFSPELEAIPFGQHAAVAGKLVYKIRSFSDIDKRVESICAPFNVVVAHKADEADTFDGRKADRVIHAGGLTLLRFEQYGKTAKSCPK